MLAEMGLHWRPGCSPGPDSFAACPEPTDRTNEAGGALCQEVPSPNVMIESPTCSMREGLVRTVGREELAP